jgi:Flp pilus assembly protein TadD
VPTIPEALTMAEAAMQAGDAAQATYIYEQILKTSPSEPQALNGLGVLAIRGGRHVDAEQYLRQAIAAWPSDPAFHNNLSETFRQQGRLSEALGACRKALELAPRSSQLHNNVGVILKQQGDLQGAVDSFRRGIELDPAAGHVHYNLANAWSELRRLDLAEVSYRRALELAPGSYDILNNFANTLELQGNWSEAMDRLDAALRLRPDYAQAHRNRALLKMLMGNLAEGWAEYEWRWKVPDVKSSGFPQPRWQGESLAGRTILLCAEQGLGDTLQFIRYAPLVKARGGQVVIQCPEMLHRLLGNTPGIDRFAAGEGSLETFDCQIPLLSLPTIFGARPEDIPADVPYLFAEPDRVARWKQRLAGDESLKIGIAWQGNPGYGGDYYRSIPLAHFEALARVPGVKLFSLQRGQGREQLSQVGSAWNVVDFDDALDQEGAFVDTAALMMNLDLVITSDTAIAHLAGGLGVNVWVALQFSPNWRWLLSGADSPWYPTMRLFRQSRFGDWGGVFQEMAEVLEEDRGHKAGGSRA